LIVASAAVAHRDAIPPRPIAPTTAAVHRLFQLRCHRSSRAAHLPLSNRAAAVHCDRATTVHLASTAVTTGNHQIAAEALLGLVQEGTANYELIVGLVGNSNDESMEDPAADGDTADGNAADGNEADGDTEDRNEAMNGLRQMGQRLHRFDILEMFFDDFAGNIEWGGEDYDNTSLFDVLNLVEGRWITFLDDPQMLSRLCYNYSTTL
jgi:hypothetical protein